MKEMAMKHMVLIIAAVMLLFLSIGPITGILAGSCRLNPNRRSGWIYSGRNSGQHTGHFLADHGWKDSLVVHPVLYCADCDQIPHHIF